jgi:hypothetical protein
MEQPSQSLPIYPLRTRVENDRREVWDMLRKKWMVLTPEEFVRQCLIHWLVNEKGYPTGLISIERGLKYNSLQKRYDLCVYDRKGQPLISMECKAPGIALDQGVAMQLMTYNSQLNAPHLLLTNGDRVLFFSLGEEGRFDIRGEVPDWGEFF